MTDKISQMSSNNFCQTQAIFHKVTTTVEALTLAQQISKKLVTDAQLGLVIYLQHRY